MAAECQLHSQTLEVLEFLPNLCKVRPRRLDLFRSRAGLEQGQRSLGIAQFFFPAGQFGLGDADAGRLERPPLGPHLFHSSQTDVKSAYGLQPLLLAPDPLVAQLPSYFAHLTGKTEFG